jgi:hypothetical protein
VFNVPLNSEGQPAGPPDWSLDLRLSPPLDADANAKFEAAATAMSALRTEISTLKALASHTEQCLIAAYRGGVSLDHLANELNLRPLQLKAVIEGQQSLIPNFC